MPTQPQDLPMLAWEPIQGIEVSDSNFIEWLIAGGSPCPDYLANAWASTEPMPMGN